jgi:arylformamidase
MIVEEVEAQYNIRRRHPESPGHYARYQAESERVRNTLACDLDVPYGTSAGETLDIFRAASARGPLFVFIHGGYWRALDKRDVSFIAEPFVAAGIGVVTINYDLTPKVEVEEIVAQSRRALRWVDQHLDRLGGDPDQVFVGGHSAGGHLAAMALLAEPALRLAGAVALSGIFDLVPLLHTNVNDAIRLDETRARALSPLHHWRPTSTPLLVGVGGGETDGFITQSTRFAAAAGVPAHVWPALDHYTLMHELARPDSAVHRAVADFIRR